MDCSKYSFNASAEANKGSYNKKEKPQAVQIYLLTHDS